MLMDRERLGHILHHPERPVQIVIAGKSHPRDEAGKKIIQDLFRFIEEGQGKNRMVFLEDYDMEVARNLVQGVDVWLNNPRRPMEASGTSGMKVVPNGGLNLSIMDGWWDEGYDPSVGWQIGDRDTVWDEGHQDWLDSRALYALIETDIAPKFYHRTDGGIPKEWVRMIKNSIKRLAPYFCTGRMVEEYTSKFYMPAADAFQRLDQKGLARAKAALEWRDKVRSAWPNVKILKVEDDARTINPVGAKFKIKAQVALGSLQPSDVKVQVVVGKIGPNRDLVGTLAIDMAHKSSSGEAETFECAVDLPDTGHQGYTLRILPSNEDVNVASELNLVRWQPS